MAVNIDKTKHMSKLAKGILEHLERFLEENNITNSTLVDEFVIARKQRADFAFPFLKNKVFIEVHGQQHFKSVEHWGGQQALDKRKAMDRGKKEILDVYFEDCIYIEFGYKKIKYEDFIKILEPAIASIKKGDMVKETKEIEKKELKSRNTTREIKQRTCSKELKVREVIKEIGKRESKRKNKFLE